jgi:lipoprotein-anchoring transpeptidase ErfK/SrfK
MRQLGGLLSIAAALCVAACSQPASNQTQATPPPAKAAANSGPPTPKLAPSDTSGLTSVVVAAAPADVAPGVLQAAPASPLAQAINQASWPATGADARRDAMIRAEVLLARAHFSPGVIDGQDGGNLHAAISAFEAARGLPVDGKLSDPVWSALTADTAPGVVTYAITPADVAGPFVPQIPPKYEDQAKLDHLGYSGPLEALAEKFRMDEKLLTALNPGVDLGRPGAVILVASSGADALPAKVATIEVDKTHRQVRAMDASGAVLAVYPATVGSTERPAPSGSFTVKGVARNPTYTYDPSRLTFGDKSMGKLTIRPGPNNPVGVVWIDLSIPTYGIHGTPDPRLVGKTASHGCVRLTNWDALQLAAAVKPGIRVSFVGVEQDGAKSRG